MPWHPPGIACSVQCMISWAMDIRQTELQNATVQATYVRHFRTTPLGEVANVHGYLSTGFCSSGSRKVSGLTLTAVLTLATLCFAVAQKGRP
jgi:hypothetical protein